MSTKEAKSTATNANTNRTVHRPVHRQEHDTKYTTTTPADDVGGGGGGGARDAAAHVTNSNGIIVPAHPEDIVLPPFVPEEEVDVETPTGQVNTVKTKKQKDALLEMDSAPVGAADNVLRGMLAELRGDHGSRRQAESVCLLHRMLTETPASAADHLIDWTWQQRQEDGGDWVVILSQLLGRRLQQLHQPVVFERDHVNDIPWLTAVFAQLLSMQNRPCWSKRAIELGVLDMALHILLHYQSPSLLADAVDIVSFLAHDLPHTVRTAGALTVVQKLAMESFEMLTWSPSGTTTGKHRGNRDPGSVNHRTAWFASWRHKVKRAPWNGRARWVRVDPADQVANSHEAGVATVSALAITLSPELLARYASARYASATLPESDDLQSALLQTALSNGPHGSKTVLWCIQSILGASLHAWQYMLHPLASAEWHEKAPSPDCLRILGPIIQQYLADQLNPSLPSLPASGQCITASICASALELLGKAIGHDASPILSTPILDVVVAMLDRPQAAVIRRLCLSLVGDVASDSNIACSRALVRAGALRSVFRALEQMLTEARVEPQRNGRPIKTCLWTLSNLLASGPEFLHAMLRQDPRCLDKFALEPLQQQTLPDDVQAECWHVIHEALRLCVAPGPEGDTSTTRTQRIATPDMTTVHEKLAPLIRHALQTCPLNKNLVVVVQALDAWVRTGHAACRAVSEDHRLLPDAMDQLKQRILADTAVVTPTDRTATATATATPSCSLWADIGPLYEATLTTYGRWLRTRIGAVETALEAQRAADMDTKPSFPVSDTSNNECKERLEHKSHDR